MEKKTKEICTLTKNESGTFFAFTKICGVHVLQTNNNNNNDINYTNFILFLIKGRKKKRYPL